MGTPLQQKHIAKLLGFDCMVKYKKGKANAVADALSRKEAFEKGFLSAISFPTNSWLDKLKTSYLHDAKSCKYYSKNLEQGV